MTKNWMRVLMALNPIGPGGPSQPVKDKPRKIELTGSEFGALVHLEDAKKQEILNKTTSNGKMITISISGPMAQLMIQADIEKLKQDIAKIEKTGSDRYGTLTLDEAKELLAKLVLAVI